jgi:hypothetical protein
MKDYLIRLLTECAPENGFAQDAIQWAIFENKVRLSYVLATDKTHIMQRYDEILGSYRAVTDAAVGAIDRVLVSLSLP